MGQERGPIGSPDLAAYRVYLWVQDSPAQNQSIKEDILCELVETPAPSQLLPSGLPGAHSTERLSSVHSGLPAAMHKREYGLAPLLGPYTGYIISI